MSFLNRIKIDFAIAIRAGVVKNQKLEKNSETLAHSQFPIPKKRDCHAAREQLTRFGHDSAEDCYKYLCQIN